MLTKFRPLTFSTFKKALFACLFFCSAFAFAQDKFEVKIKFKVNEGTFDGAEVLIIKDGSAPVRKAAQAKMDLMLDFQKSYVIKFTKAGYITKSIEIDTHVPQSNLNDGFEPYPFEVKLFKQYEGVNIVVFNQPVAKIAFSSLADDFDYNVDYTRSIQAELKIAEDQLQEKQDEDLRQAKNKPIGTPVPPPNPPTSNTANTTGTPSTGVNNSSPNKQAANDEAKALKKAEEEAKKRQAEEEDARKKQASADSEARKKAEKAAEEERLRNASAAAEEDRKRTAEKAAADEKERLEAKAKADEQKKLNAAASAEEKQKMAALAAEEEKLRIAAIAAAEEKKRLESQADAEERKRRAAAAAEEARLKLLAQKEEREQRISSMKMTFASESGDLLAGDNKPVLVSKEIIEEKTRTIHRVVIRQGPKTTVYDDIKYNWGAEFFFKNGVSITGIIYELQTNIK